MFKARYEAVMHVIKVAYILYPYKVKNVDSLERFLNEVVCMMDKNWQIHIISNFSWLLRKLNCDYQVHVVPVLPSNRLLPLTKLSYSLAAIFKGVKAVRKYEIPVIGCLDGHVYLGLLAYIISRITHSKCIIRVNEDTILSLTISLRKRWGNLIFSKSVLLHAITSILRRVERYLFTHVDWVITHGPMDYEKIKRITKRVTLIPLWIDTEKFKPIESQKRRHEKNKVLLFVGRLAFIKGVKYLLRAFKQVLETYPDATLVLVGSGQDEKEYRKIAMELGIQKEIKFIGYVPHDKLSRYYQSADVYVLPSLREEFSNTILEAIACQVPVVATNVGSNPYLVKDGSTGFLVPPKHSDVLADRIIYVLSNQDIARKTASNARQSIKQYTRARIGEMHKKAIIGCIKF